MRRGRKLERDEDSIRTWKSYDILTVQAGGFQETVLTSQFILVVRQGEAFECLFQALLENELFL